jgi:dTDP-4-dehydrorhamnose 3,5-epimerase
MIFTPTEIAGAFIIDVERLADSRGFFARAWCRDEFARHGLVSDLSQANIAWSAKQGTLRGLHFQAAPHEEAKLVRCTQGAAYLVVADIRAKSTSHGRWIGVDLTADNRRLLYVPPGCAQGYQTLADETELFYQMSTAYVPGAARGVRHDDPYFQIRWPLPPVEISAADLSWPLFNVKQNLKRESLPAGRS